MHVKQWAIAGDSITLKKELYETGGGSTLIEIVSKKQFLANRVEPHIEQAVVDLAIEQPAWEPLKSQLKKTSY